MRNKKKKRPKLVSFLNNETFQNCLLKSLLKEKEHQKPQRELPNFLATKKTKRLVFTPSLRKVFAFETDKGLVGRGKLGRPTSLLLLSFVEVKVVFVFLCVFET